MSFNTTNSGQIRFRRKSDFCYLVHYKLYVLFFLGSKPERRNMYSILKSIIMSQKEPNDALYHYEEAVSILSGEEEENGN